MRVKSVVVAGRVKEPARDVLNAHAEEIGKSPSEVISDALDAHVPGLAEVNQDEDRDDDITDENQIQD